MAHDINEAVSGAIDGVGRMLDVGSGTGVDISVVCCNDEAGDRDIETASPTSAIPKMVEKILATLAIFGITKSFTVIPPPKRPARRAIQPAIARIVGRVIGSSF
jgi:hypothetical protein